MFFKWAKEINEEVQILIQEKGDQPNGYRFTPLATAILKDCKLIPLWSSVMRNHFGYGSVPATSAAVESEFNNLKTRILKKKVKLRADEFIIEQMEVLNGHAKMVVGSRQKVPNDKIISIPDKPFLQKKDSSDLGCIPHEELSTTVDNQKATYELEGNDEQDRESDETHVDQDDQLFIETKGNFLDDTDLLLR